MNEQIKVNIIGELDMVYEHGRRVYDPNGVSCAMTVDGVSDVKVLMREREQMYSNLEPIKIKQATKDGYIEMEPGGVCDLSFPTSSPSRGRVQDGGTICPTLTAGNTEICRVESRYRIRKLTPRECLRLMGVKDDETDRMLEVNSNSQCYKQAGNSIVVDVMSAMFKKLF